MRKIKPTSAILGQDRQICVRFSRLLSGGRPVFGPSAVSFKFAATA
jgi:hypothetical protein